MIGTPTIYYTCLCSPTSHFLTSDVIHELQHKNFELVNWVKDLKVDVAIAEQEKKKCEGKISWTLVIIYGTVAKWVRRNFVQCQRFYMDLAVNVPVCATMNQMHTIHNLTNMIWNRRIRFMDKNLFPMSSGVSSERASERMSAAERASEASSAERANEWAVRANERLNERVAQSLHLYS